MADLATTVASWATAAGIAVAAYQLRLARRNAVGTFESQFVARYEAILSRLPDSVVMEMNELSDPTVEELRVFHDYYALCDEETFYRRQGKVSGATWSDWERGMQLNLQRQTFRFAWESLRLNDRLDDRFADFERHYLNLLAAEHFDPYESWPRRKLGRLRRGVA